MLLFSGVSGQLSFAQNNRDSMVIQAPRQGVMLIKNELIKFFGVEAVVAIRSRKSCNCGCDIQKESYQVKEKNNLFETFDFCDSYVFEWKGLSDNPNNTIEAIGKILDKNGFTFVNKEPVFKHKFRIDKYTFEGSDVLTFLEVKVYPDNRLDLKLSLSTPE